MIRRDGLLALFERSASRRGVVYSSPHRPVHDLADILVIENTAHDLLLRRDACSTLWLALLIAASGRPSSASHIQSSL